MKAEAGVCVCLRDVVSRGFFPLCVFAPVLRMQNEALQKEPGNNEGQVGGFLFVRNPLVAFKIISGVIG